MRIYNRMRVYTFIWKLRMRYLVWVARDSWDKMSLEQRGALLDHEFCHCAETARGDWGLCQHDVEEFVAIIERHGLWKRDLERLGEAVQSCLPGLEVRSGEGVVTGVPVGVFGEVA